MIKKIFWIFLFLNSLLICYSITNINSCTDDPNIAGETYELTQNININGATCLQILQDNITLDCKNYTITGDTTGATYGIDVFIRNNITIKNCRVYKFGNGIRLAGGIKEHHLTNITSNNNSNNGIWINFCSNNLLNNIISNYNGYQGMYIQDSTFNIINNFTSHQNTQYAIYFSNGDSNNITNSNLTNNIISNIHLMSTSLTNTFTNNYLGTNSSITGNSIPGNNFNGNYWNDLISYPYCLANAPSICDVPIISTSTQNNNNIFPAIKTTSFLELILIIITYIIFS